MSFVEYLNKFSPKGGVAKTPLKVNNHMHTPYSFSAFDAPEEALDQAVEEGVDVVGVNDFFTFEAYKEWCDGAFQRGLFPLFNVEFIGLNEEDQKAGLKVNDPGNPGRTYFSGKSLAYPLSLSSETKAKIEGLVADANDYVAVMTGKVNALFEAHGYDFKLSYNDMKKELARGQVRERHLARAIRILAEKQFTVDEDLHDFYVEILQKENLPEDIYDEAVMENEIRGALLKAGKPAYVEEDPKGFLSVDEIRSMILEAGGIPTYPFLADAVPGYTDFERDLPTVAANLKARGVYSVEFIPTRNVLDELKKYAQFLQNEGFVVSFGTEHNSPGKQPVEVFAKGKVALDKEMLEVNYEGACISAAHQYLYAKDGEGILDKNGVFKADRRQAFFELGNELIKHVTLKKAVHGVI